jgi:hypothetical protein
MSTLRLKHFFQLAVAVALLPSCTILATRPVQPMADAAAALKAAQEVGAQNRTPTSTELYRKGLDWFERAKTEFRLKNFHLAELYSGRARLYAESAEFEAMRAGGKRANPGSGPEQPDIVQDPMATPNFTSGPKPSSGNTMENPTDNPFSNGPSLESDPLSPPPTN